MFFRSKRDKSDEASRNTCYVIEKYQPYVHFRFVDQGWQSDFDFLNILRVLNIMLFYNVVFLLFIFLFFPETIIALLCAVKWAVLFNPEKTGFDLWVKWHLVHSNSFKRATLLLGDWQNSHSVCFYAHLPVCPFFSNKVLFIFLPPTTFKREEKASKMVLKFSKKNLPLSEKALISIWQILKYELSGYLCMASIWATICKVATEHRSQKKLTGFCPVAS